MTWPGAGFFLYTQHFPARCASEVRENHNYDDGRSSFLQRPVFDKLLLCLEYYTQGMCASYLQQHLGENRLHNVQQAITFLYKCCLFLLYTQQKWQESTVIFLSKAGKKDPRQCKEHRAIVPSNFVLKGLEQLITWGMDELLVYYPIHPLQHGFQVGKGTDTHLCLIIVTISNNLSWNASFV